jgi:hypothetical protein
MRKTIQLLLAGLVMVGAGAAQAKGRGNPTGGTFSQQHPRRNEVNQRVDNQRARINEGVRDGKLSPQQAAQLRANDRAIKQQEHAEVRANGGHLTPGEQKQLNQEENANSQMIRAEKHPAQ